MPKKKPDQTENSAEWDGSIYITTNSSLEDNEVTVLPAVKTPRTVVSISLNYDEFNEIHGKAQKMRLRLSTFIKMAAKQYEVKE